MAIEQGQRAGGGGELLSSRSARLLVNFGTTAQPPVYSTLFTLPITTVLPSSYLAIDFTCGVLMVGASAANLAPTVRFRINGTLVAPGGGITVNTLVARIMPLAYSHREVVSAGVQTVIAEVAYFGPAGQTLVINALTLPDLMHAHLRIQEQRT